ncbi:OsmC family protein [Sinomonas notoginsengisoli]|uniref:OsmC family protein n=1 Tax=Sinomonas notoginsengisoli TaxID=1457311 RepID=UPI001F1A01C2|nr:OsmC family protein [Sinomonas notoginsengisoli]
MAIGEHHYSVSVIWTGNRGTGTSGVRDFGREHEVALPGLPVLPGTADPSFRGTPDRYNPEQLLLAALAQCHMLSYLFEAARHGVVVTAYTDAATGTMRTHGTSGEFTEVILHPRVELADETQRELADRLHDNAHEACFIARSVNFPVLHTPEQP